MYAHTICVHLHVIEESKLGCLPPTPGLWSTPGNDASVSCAFNIGLTIVSDCMGLLATSVIHREETDLIPGDRTDKSFVWSFFRSPFLFFPPFCKWKRKREKSKIIPQQPRRELETVKQMSISKCLFCHFSEQGRCRGHRGRRHYGHRGRFIVLRFCHVHGWWRRRPGSGSA